jgi:hypothetical protein
MVTSGHVPTPTRVIFRRSIDRPSAAAGGDRARPRRRPAVFGAAAPHISNVVFLRGTVSFWATLAESVRTLRRPAVIRRDAA